MQIKPSLTTWEERLPPEFEYDAYVADPGNRDVASFGEYRARRHYGSFGRFEGRVCSRVKCRADFVALVPVELPILEVGPFFSPAFRRPRANVRYLDCLSTESLLQRAGTVKGAAFENVPEIDYVWSGEAYRDIVGRTFSVVYSSHNIEHQTCLIRHLQDLESVLESDGAAFFVIPDKRYCFDHFFAETNLADVFDAWVGQRRRHSVRDILEHRFFCTHNDAVRHWRGDHGEWAALAPMEGDREIAFRAEVAHLRSSEEYADVHAWKFTPDSFVVLMDNLFRLGMTKFRVARVYRTVKDSQEFYVVLTLSDD